MNLIIDIGNTLIKLSLFNGGDLILAESADNIGIDRLMALKDEYPLLNKAILSSVRDYPGEIHRFLQSSFDLFIELNRNTPVPLTNLYRTPETLGFDRLAAAVGAAELFPRQNLMVIDAGTAITFDFVTDRGEYLGGNISPGLEIRFKALHHFTGKLPLVAPSDNFSHQGNDTETAIRAGVQLGMIFEIERYIDHFNRIYNNLKVIMTGGNAFFFEKKIKNAIFVIPNLSAVGLNRILEFNN